MKYFHILICLCLQLGWIASAQANDEPSYAVFNISKHLLKDANAVLRIDQNYLEVISEGRAKYRSKWAITILNKKADHYAELKLVYDKLREIDLMKGTLYDQFGKEIRKLKKSDIKDESAVSSYSIYEDTRVKIASLAHHSYPYTVEFEIELDYKGVLAYPRWQPQGSSDISVESSEMQVDMPQGLPLRFREMAAHLINQEQSSQAGNTSEAGKPSQVVNIQKQEDRVLYSWKVRNLVSIDREPFAPDWRETVPTVYLAPSRFEVEGYKGEMSTWEEFGKWRYQLIQDQDQLPHSTIQRMKDLTAGIQDPLEKIRKIYEYLQSKTRYVSIQEGIGGWQPFPANYVDEKGYGDCKALSNYTKALLKSVDIKAHYTVVKAGSDELPILSDFPSNQFNHVILCVPLPQDTVWLECTSQTQAFGYVSDFTGDRDVLLITPEGGKLVHTPVYGQDDNLQHREATVKILESGNAEAQIKTRYQALQERGRGDLVEASQEDQKKWLYRALDIPNFQIEDFKLTRYKERIPYVEEELSLTIPKCASKSGSRLFLTPNLMERWDYVPERNENRKLEVVLDGDYDFSDRDVIRYELPAGYEIEYQPEPVVIQSPFGEYKASTSWEGNVLTYTRECKMNRGRFAPSSYGDLVEFFKQIAQADKDKVVFVQKSN